MRLPDSGAGELDVLVIVTCKRALLVKIHI